MSIPGSASPLFFQTAAGAGTVTLEKSVRFNSGDSAYLNRTPSSAGSNTTWTLSTWVKKTGNDNHVFGAGAGNTPGRFGFGFNGSDKIFAFVIASGSTVFSITTDAVFRDPAGWYHIVLIADTGNSTQADRFKIYVNGVLQSVSGTLMPSSQNTFVNTTAAHTFGRRSYTAADYFNGYLASTILVDGTAKDETDFGAFDDNGVWQAAAYSGSFGTNGFHLFDFANESGIGNDSSGNDNDWTVNNLSTTAGVGNDVLFDVPTNGDSSDDTGAGGEVSGCYATWNPLFGENVSLSNGNLKAESTTSGAYAIIASTIAMTSGKWYMEYHYTANAGEFITFGVSQTNRDGTEGSGVSDTTEDFGFKCWSNGFKAQTNGVNQYSYSSTVSNGDILSLAFDADAGKLWVAQNGTWMTNAGGTGDPANGNNPDFSSLTYSGGYFFMAGPYGGSTSATLEANFGARPWAYAAPSGFKALCTTNLPTPTIADGSAHFQANLWTGSGSARSITTTGMSPDLIWIKQRSGSYHNVVFDSVRGATYRLNTNLTNAEDTGAGVGVVSSFNSDGFSLDGGGGNVNQSSGTYVGWAWDAGSSTVSNTDGSLTSTVRANTTAGMSIVTYTGNLSSAGNATVGHGLGVAPSLVITKSRSATGSWAVQHISLGTNEFMELNTTAAVANSSSIGAGALPKPTSSVFYASYITGLNINNVTFVGYCFAPVAGYSAFGKFTSNNTEDNVFLYTGFAPRYILWRITNTSGGWSIYDAARDPVNPNNTYLRANSADAEATATPGVMDFLSNGFKVRNTLGGTNSLIYMAFASNPFQANGGLAR